MSETILYDRTGRKLAVPDANLDALLETGDYSEDKPKPAPAKPAPKE